MPATKMRTTAKYVHIYMFVCIYIYIAASLKIVFRGRMPNAIAAQVSETHTFACIVLKLVSRL